MMFNFLGETNELNNGIDILAEHLNFELSATGNAERLEELCHRQVGSSNGQSNMGGFSYEG